MKKISVLLLCLFFSFQINAQSASSTTFTTSSAGWFQVGKWTLGQRGSERVVISLNGGAYTPQKVVIDVFKDWSTGFLLDVKGARNSYIEQIRITKDNSYYYLDAYFDRVISQSNSLHLHNIEGKESGFVLNSGVLPVSTGSVFYETGDIQFKTVLNNTLDLRKKLLVSGNVGIGTSSPSTTLEVQNGTLKVSGTSSLGQESSRFIVDSGDSYGHSLMELRNINGVMFKVLGSGNAALNGKLESKEIKVTNTPTADFVFEESYNLPTLESIENHIKEKKHLPEIASAKEMKQNGVNVGSFQIQLLQKIEELTLYTIQQEKKLEAQKEELESYEGQLNQQAKEVEKLKELVRKVLKESKL